MRESMAAFRGLAGFLIFGASGCGGSGASGDAAPSVEPRPVLYTTREVKVPEGDFLLAVSTGEDRLLKVDPATATATPFNATGLRLDNIEDLTYDPVSDRIIGVYWQGFPGLLRIDPKTGVGELGPKIFGSSLHAQSFVESLAVVDGELYGSASSKDSYCPDCSDRLVKINPRTGEATEIGRFGPKYLNIEAMAYSPKFGLVGADIGTLVPPEFHKFNTYPTLVRIDTRTGRATRIGDLPPVVTKIVPEPPPNPQVSPEGPFVCALAFSPDGLLYGAAMPTHFSGLTQFLAIDPSNAAVRDVGTMNATMIMGMVYVRPPAVVTSTPAPAPGKSAEH